MLIVLSQNCSYWNPLSIHTWQQLLQFFHKGLLLTALSRFRTPVCWKQKTICNEGPLALECRVNFLLIESLRKRRFWATDENRKWDVFLHILFSHYRLPSVETISLKIWEKSLSWHRVAWNFRGSFFSRIFRRFAKIISHEKKDPRKFTPFLRITAFQLTDCKQYHSILLCNSNKMNSVLVSVWIYNSRGDYLLKNKIYGCGT